MGLFDEIKRQIQEAMEEAQAQARPQPQRQVRPAEPIQPPPPPAASAPRPQRSAPPARTGRTAEPGDPGQGIDRQWLRSVLHDRQGLRRAVLLAEILDRPKALRRR